MVVMLVDRTLKRIIPIRSTPFVIGRHSQADYQLRSPLVSRTHCKLEMGKDSVLVSDEASRNGTLLNGKNLEPSKQVPLHDGDRLLVGPIELVIRMGNGVELEHVVNTLDDDAVDPAGATHDAPPGWTNQPNDPKK